MENIHQMRARHEVEIETLQGNCKHDNISGWVNYEWAPGHFGFPVKVCDFCGIIVERQKMEDLKFG